MTLDQIVFIFFLAVSTVVLFIQYVAFFTFRTAVRRNPPFAKNPISTSTLIFSTVIWLLGAQAYIHAIPLLKG